MTVCPLCNCEVSGNASNWAVHVAGRRHRENASRKGVAVVPAVLPNPVGANTARVVAPPARLPPPPRPPARIPQPEWYEPPPQPVPVPVAMTPAAAKRQLAEWRARAGPQAFTASAFARATTRYNRAVEAVAKGYALGRLFSAHVSGRVTNATPPMVTAAKQGNVAALEALLKAGGDINEPHRWTEQDYRMYGVKEFDWDGDNPLLAAIRAGREEAALWLLDRGADPLTESCENDNVYDNSLSLAERHLPSVVQRIKDVILALSRERPVPPPAPVFAAAPAPAPPLSLNTATVDELKARCREVDIPCGGVKAELVSRLQAYELMQQELRDTVWSTESMSMQELRDYVHKHKIAVEGRTKKEDLIRIVDAHQAGEPIALVKPPVAKKAKEESDTKNTPSLRDMFAKVQARAELKIATAAAALANETPAAATPAPPLTPPSSPAAAPAHAEVTPVDAPAAAAAAAVPPAVVAAPAVNLSSLTVPVLRRMASERGLKGTSRMDKKTLVEQLSQLPAVEATSTEATPAAPLPKVHRTEASDVAATLPVEAEATPPVAAVETAPLQQPPLSPQDQHQGGQTAPAVPEVEVQHTSRDTMPPSRTQGKTVVSLEAVKAYLFANDLPTTGGRDGCLKTMLKYKHGFIKAKTVFHCTDCGYDYARLVNRGCPRCHGASNGPRKICVQCKSVFFHPSPRYTKCGVCYVFVPEDRGDFYF